MHILTLLIFIILLLAMPARGEELGRLFTTPQERTMLERLRHSPATEIKKREETQESAMQEANIPQTITINGIVSRSDGNSTMWVNGLNSLEGDLDAQRFQIKPGRTGEVVIQLPKSLAPIRLKPGETYEPSLSTVFDIHQQALKRSREGSSDPEERNGNKGL